MRIRDQNLDTYNLLVLLKFYTNNNTNVFNLYTSRKIITHDFLLCRTNYLSRLNDRMEGTSF
jgi:hypothetical protein